MFDTGILLYYSSFLHFVVRDFGSNIKCWWADERVCTEQKTCAIKRLKTLVCHLVCKETMWLKFLVSKWSASSLFIFSFQSYLINARVMHKNRRPEAKPLTTNSEGVSRRWKSPFSVTSFCKRVHWNKNCFLTYIRRKGSFSKPSLKMQVGVLQPFLSIVLLIVKLTTIFHELYSYRP